MIVITTKHDLLFILSKTGTNIIMAMHKKIGLHANWRILPSGSARRNTTYAREIDCILHGTNVGLYTNIRIFFEIFRSFRDTVEPRFNEVAGDRPNVFVKWRVRYIEVLFHTF